MSGGTWTPQDGKVWLARGRWKARHEVDFALLDTPAEQIGFLKDLIRNTEGKIAEVRKKPLEASGEQLIAELAGEHFSTLKPTAKERRKRWQEAQRELSPIRENQEKLRELEADMSLLLDKLKIARANERAEKSYQPTAQVPPPVPKDAQEPQATQDRQEAPSDEPGSGQSLQADGENLNITRKPHTAYAEHSKKSGMSMKVGWKALVQLALESNGEKLVSVPGYGRIYLKRNRRDVKDILQYHFHKFPNDDPGYKFTKTAFESAYKRN